MLISRNLLVVKRIHVWQRVVILIMKIDIRRHVLWFLFTMCLNFQLLELSLRTSLESVHVVLISAAVYDHWIVNVGTGLLGLTKNSITVFHWSSWHLWLSGDSVIIINGWDESVLFSSVVTWCHGWLLNSNCLSGCHLFISIHWPLLS